MEGDGQRDNASVLTKGMNPADRLAGDASAIPQCRHPLINKLPRQRTIKPQSQRFGQAPGEQAAGRLRSRRYFNSPTP